MNCHVRAAFTLVAAATFTNILLVDGSGDVHAQGGPSQYDALADRVKKLEARVADDASSNSGGGKPGAAGGTRFHAPFTIVDSKGKPMVEVLESGDAHLLRMGSMASGTAIQLQRNAERATVLAQSGDADHQARLGVSASGPRLEVYVPEHSTIIGAGPDNKHGLFVRDGGGGAGQAPAKVLGELAVTVNQTGGIVRLFDKSARQVVSMGGNPQFGGRGQLGVSAPGKDIATLISAGESGAGEILILGDGNGKAILELSGSKRHVLVSNRAGNPAAVMQLSQGGAGSGGNFTAVDGSGQNVASMGMLSGGGGALCAIHMKRGNQCFP